MRIVRLPINILETGKATTFYVLGHFKTVPVFQKKKKYSLLDNDLLAQIKMCNH